MPETLPENSVGLVTPQTQHFEEPLALACGRTLENYDLVYETYGELNADKSNAILICHALSGDHHAAGYHSMDDGKPGWWESCIGPDKPFDTNHFFIVALNNLGGCSGSTGPTTENPNTGRPWGADFPIVTVEDWTQSQARLADMLGIKQWAAAVGGSLGGMQVMQWTIDFPDRIRHALVIASAPKLSAQNIAFNEVARQAILSDPEFFDGHFYQHNTVPHRGLRLARMLGHITYLSDEAMRGKFGRELREGKINFSFEVEFQIESYLRYQGQSFVNRFDANSYLLMTKTLDYYDPAAKHDNELARCFAAGNTEFLLCAFSSDWRFAPERSREIARALLDARRKVTYAEIEANQGHDAFLMPIPQYMNVLNAYMARIKKEIL